MCLIDVGCCLLESIVLSEQSSAVNLNCPFPIISSSSMSYDSSDEDDSLDLSIASNRYFIGICLMPKVL